MALALYIAWGALLLLSLAMSARAMEDALAAPGPVAESVATWAILDMPGLALFVAIAGHAREEIVALAGLLALVVGVVAMPFSLWRWPPWRGPGRLQVVRLVSVVAWMVSSGAAVVVECLWT